MPASSDVPASAAALAAFGPATRAWFSQAFAAPTPVQVAGWAEIAAGHDTLMLAPTGSGKTLAAFLWCLDRLAHRADDVLDPPGVRVLYVSPMKALVYDVDRNLRTPLAGIRAAAFHDGRPLRDISVSVRTGDTPAADRRRFQRDPGHVLVTTPESLYLLLSSQARAALATVETVIVDEIHAVAGTKRGVHLALSLERLSELVTRPTADGSRRPTPQRVGLSATQRPLAEIAAFLGGADATGQPRPVAIVDRSAPPDIDLQIVVPVDDMDNPVPVPLDGGELDAVDADAAAGTAAGTPEAAASADEAVGGAIPADSSMSGDHLGIWPAIYPRLFQLVLEHRSTILFTNSRRLCERIAQRLNELADEAGVAVPLVRAHHGSVSHAERAEIEERLKAGQLRGIVATSSLELGIDMGAVDLVVMVESPGAVSRGLQRVGRAGHQVGGTSKGRLFPKYRGDLLEAAAVVWQMGQGSIESTAVPQNCLDVLAQHLVSACLEKDWDVDALGRLVRGAWPYRDLAEGPWLATVEMLAGRYAGDDLVDLKPRLVWDRSIDRLRARRDARLAVFSKPGTIPDRGLFGVFLAGDAAVDGDGRSRRRARGRRLGELDEEMVYESRVGDTIILGATTWRISDIQRDRVLVEPAPGQPGRMPFWRGDGPGRPLGLGRALGELTRRVDQLGDAAVPWLADHCRMDDRAARNLLAYLAEQRAATGTVPTDRAITIERFRDELGDWRICILSPFGARVHAPWALALEATLGDPASGATTGVQSMWTDDGIVLRFPDVDLLLADGDDAAALAALPDQSVLVPDPDEVADLLTEQLRHSSVFAARFREAAGRALLLTGRRPGQRSPLWAQRLAAQRLLSAAQQHPDFPIVLETYRECLHDVFDLPALVEVLAGIRDRRIRVDEVETDTASPFARGLVYSYVAEFLYDGDAPLAERRAQALSLDRGLLAELLGDDELHQLLDVDVMAAVEGELQGLDDSRRARSPDGLHDLLRRVGDLSEAELTARVRPLDGRDGADTARAWLDALRAEHRVATLRIAGQDRVVVVEDLGRFRDALGCAPPPGTPVALLGKVQDALQGLVRRYARTHGPFSADALATRFGLATGLVEPALRLLLAEGALVHGALRGPDDQEWCDVDVLRRIKRRTLSKLRGEVAAVDASALGRFQLGWQGVLAPGERPRRAALTLLDEAVVQLEGCALPFSDLERRILPARVPGYQGAMLDDLGASGAIVWVGAGRLGARDGRIALLRRDQAPLLLDPPPTADDAAASDDIPWSDLHAAVVDNLEQRGASFTAELARAVAAQAGAPAVTLDDLQAVLWDLVWAGMVTNDTFHPLRSLAGGRRRRSGAPTRRSLPGRSRAGAALSRGGGWSRGGPRRGRLGGGLRAGGGRWSLVADLLAPVVPTRRAHARAVMLLDRYGLVAAGHARAEGLPGGFSAVYDVLRALEESGRVRRGHFVEGLDGAQFALAGAVDRLRACRGTPDPGDDASTGGGGCVCSPRPIRPCPGGSACPGRRQAARPRPGGRRGPRWSSATAKRSSSSKPAGAASSASGPCRTRTSAAAPRLRCANTAVPLRCRPCGSNASTASQRAARRSALRSSPPAGSATRTGWCCRPCCESGRTRGARPGQRVRQPRLRMFWATWWRKASISVRAGPSSTCSCRAWRMQSIQASAAAWSTTKGMWRARRRGWPRSLLQTAGPPKRSTRKAASLRSLSARSSGCMARIVAASGRLSISS